MSKEAKKVEQLLKRQATAMRKKKRAKKGTGRWYFFRAKVGRIKARLRALDAVPKKPPYNVVATNWALRQEGITEKPPNSNWGEPVSDWIKRTGYSGPVPWCGCFVHEAVVEKGGAKIPSEVRLGYNGYINEDAKANKNGLRQVAWSEARKGDIITFDFNHIALVRGRPSATSIPTVEGNTSPLSSGSQYNGGAVAAKTRLRANTVCIARPNYPRRRT